MLQRHQRPSAPIRSIKIGFHRQQKTTIRGSESRAVVNHPAAALCIQPPMFETLHL
jgi:hypothetical protein